MKHSFKNDYAEGCHSNILKALAETNNTQQNGYGQDEYCRKAEEIILRKIRKPESKVFFVSGGTQANLISISAFLRTHESIVAAETGHIFTNETGAIEATGHKVHGVISEDGKISTHDIQNILDLHGNVPHQVKPKLVYISNSTELGTIYSARELSDLSDFCKQKNLLLFMDGARIGHALRAFGNDLSLELIASKTDAFTIGGTKNGALLGEAIVINNPELSVEFGFHIKQKGGMLAKGRLLGLQFVELFKDDLYFDLADHANKQAMRLKDVFQKIGCCFLTENLTNQIFPILSPKQIEHLAEHFDFYVWKKIDENKSAIRIITSWATQEDVVSLFAEKINEL